MSTTELLVKKFIQENCNHKYIPASDEKELICIRCEKKAKRMKPGQGLKTEMIFIDEYSWRDK